MSDRLCARLLCVFAENASGSGSRDTRSRSCRWRVKHGGRGPPPPSRHCRRRRKLGIRHIFDVQSYHLQLQHRCWRWSAGPQQRRFKYGRWRCSAFTQYERHREHGHWTAALENNTTGEINTANGTFALFSNTIGFGNTAVGAIALLNNTGGGGKAGGSANTAVGVNALGANTTGAFNTAVGLNALANNIDGVANAALGSGAGSGVTTADNVICIGASGADVDDSCYIGNIHGATIDPGTALPVGVDATGKLGTILSSQRFKHDIKPMDKSSEAILALKPVTFRYNQKIDPKAIPQFGLVAEDVEKVNPDLVVRDKEGKPYSVRYDQVNAMLLNEFLKEHSTVQELKKEIATLTATVKEQAAQIQKVSAQLEASKPSPQVVNNP
jgi:hypothetical protein